MKKNIVLLTAVVITICCAVTVAAQDEFATAGDLYQHWSETSFPDYVCGVWSNDGTMENLTVAVLNNEDGNAGKQEILDLVADDSSVTFVYQEYSYNYLRKVQNEISPYFEKDVGLSTTAVNEYKNRVELGILTDRKDDDATLEMLAELREKYGDIFIVSYTEGVYTYDTITEIGTTAAIGAEQDGVPTVQIAVICFAVGLLAFVTVFAASKRVRTLQTNTGENISTTSFSTQKIENMVKNSNAEVTPELDAKILNKIENS